MSKPRKTSKKSTGHCQQLCLACRLTIRVRFIVIGMGYSEALSALYVMELEGMLYTGSYQILAQPS
eukprot:5152280-Amphidinium_carterae.1